MGRKSRHANQATPATGAVVGRFETSAGDQIVAAAITLPVPVWDQLTADIAPLGTTLPLDERIAIFSRQRAVEWKWLALRPSLFSVDLDDDMAF